MLTPALPAWRKTIFFTFCTYIRIYIYMVWVVWGGVRWGGAVTFHCANTSGCPLALDIHTSCYAREYSLALHTRTHTHTRHAALVDVLLALAHTHMSCYASGCSLALDIQMLQVAVVKPSKQGLRCWTNTEIPVRCKELISKQTSTRIQRLSLE